MSGFVWASLGLSGLVYPICMGLSVFDIDYWVLESGNSVKRLIHTYTHTYIHSYIHTDGHEQFIKM